MKRSKFTESQVAFASKESLLPERGKSVAGSGSVRQPATFEEKYDGKAAIRKCRKHIMDN